MSKLLAILIIAFTAAFTDAQTITVSVAISMKEAVTKASHQFEKETGTHVELSFGASGQLASQIENGAPIDLFISAADKQVNDLINKGVADANTRAVVAGNALVIVAPASAATAPTLKDLADAAVTRVAIGEPKTVPDGQYAIESLKNAKLLETVRSKIIFGTNVRQVLDYVIRGEVSAGLVYSTDARQAGDKVKTGETVAENLHSPIVYPAIVVTKSAHEADAIKFRDYLLSDPGQDILKSFGFTSPPPAAKPTP